MEQGAQTGVDQEPSDVHLVQVGGKERSVNDVVSLLPRLRLAAAELEHGDLSRGDALVERALQVAIGSIESYPGSTALEPWLLKIMQEEHTKALEASSRD